MESLKDRVIIITGASRGIGKAAALRLAAEGAHIVVAAKTTYPNPRLPGTIQETVDEIKAQGGDALGVKCNVRHLDHLRNLVATTRKHYGRIDGLVNNAGAIWLELIGATPEKRLDLVHEVNYKAPFLLCQMVIPYMKENGWGHIVNMSPPIDSSLLGGRIAYLSSKFSMTFLTLGLAQELKKEPIAINSLWPKTLVESLATKNWGMGRPEEWRKADILADALLWIMRQNPQNYSGGQLIDEDVLRKLAGLTDFSSYNCLPGGQPRILEWPPLP